MKVPKFLFGLLIGVSVGLIIWYWQKSTSAEDGALAVLDRLAAAEARVRELEAHLRLKQDKALEGQSVPKIKTVEVDDPEDDLQQKKPDIPEPSDVDSRPEADEKQVDDLQKISGIGPTYAKRLQEAGILTFSDLAQESPEHLREVTGLKAFHSADPQVWITEAKKYSTN